LVADRNGWQIFPELDKTSKEPRIAAREMKSDNQSHKEHVKNFIECVRERKVATACTIETGALVAKYAHVGNIAARMGGATLQYNEQKRSFGQDGPDRLLKPSYRKPWTFPSV
jgi:hypothetical protein